MSLNRLLVALYSIILSVAGAASVSYRQQQHTAASVSTHGTALALALKSRRALRGKAGKAIIDGSSLAETSTDDDDTDTDDDDDDDDDEKEKALEENETQVLAASTMLMRKANASSNASAHAKQETAAQKLRRQRIAEAVRKVNEEADEAEKAKQALEAAKSKQDDAESEIDKFQDDAAFESKIASQKKLLVNETQSPALASFLGDLRTEMRKYAMPSYPKYLQGRLDAADAKVESLEAELKKDGELEEKAEEKKKEKTEEATDKKKKVEANGSLKDAFDKNKMSKKDVAAPEKAEKETQKVATDAQKGVETDALAREVAQKSGETWAISFFANVAMMAVVFAMASAENAQVRNYTWFLLDQVVAIFLAVMYFNAFDSLLDFHFANESKLAVSIIHAVVMLAIVLFVAYSLRKQQVALAILCGAGAHVVSFSSIHAAASTQNYWVGMSYTYSACLGGLCCLAVALGAIGYLVYTAKHRAGATEDDDFMDKTDDLENDFGAMATSVVFTMFVRFILTGHHPVDDESEFDHSKRQRTYMLCYAFICLIVAGFVVQFCSKAAEGNTSYPKQRVLTFCTSVAVMNVAWAFLYWGEWEFFQALYPGEAIKGRVMFAITVTVVGAVGLVGLAKIKSSPAESKTISSSVKKEKKVALTALGLLVAWSWELCFDAAVEAMCDGVSHPAGWKVGSTLALASIVVPVWAYYLKPIASRAAEEIGA